MRYRCPCGYEADNSPSSPDREIVSAYHIHRHGDVRGQAYIVRMEQVEIAANTTEREPEIVGAIK